MNKDSALHYISNAMNLRPPQRKSLELFANYLESEVGQEVLARRVSPRIKEISKLEKNTRQYASEIPVMKQFEAFERLFPAFTFALATGVGKTRLMGAFVAYLFLVYKIQNYMIVAPGNTIYRKLVDEFSKGYHPKYVFKGLEELNINSVRVITRDNYEQSQSIGLFGSQIQINIFNVQQFAQKDLEQEKGITKYSELLGESYFDYLSSLKDLVLLMDESHHYHADAAMGSLDRIDPLFGLEFTATPYTGNQIGKGKARQPEQMKNILYAYNLGDAIQDGFVKDPWIGTEADIDFSQWEADKLETDARKLQLAAFFHERTKLDLREYSILNKVRYVKPVMLVVAKDTKHASELRNLIDSDSFRGGAYKGKVIEVHTKTKGDEADETIEKLLSLENPDNIVEIVIHVNMLKEGWDVSNIFTIAPIRSSASEILTEQTIGRGLRLPYGVKTGNRNVDRVMVVAHDNYSKVIEAARTSKLIQPSNIESVSSEETKISKEIIEVPSVYEASIQAQIKASSAIMRELESQAIKALSSIIKPDMPEDVRAATIQVKTEQLVQIVAKQQLYEQSFSAHHNHSITFKETERPALEGNQWNLFSEEAKRELEKIRIFSKQTLETRNIPIPRLILTPHFAELKLNDFDLDTKRLSTYTTGTSILEQRLQGTEQLDLFGVPQVTSRETVVTRVSSLGDGSGQSPESTIIAALVDCPLVDYEEQQVLLRKLAKQAVDFYRTFIGDFAALKMMVENNYRQIANEIYLQILEHKEYIEDSYLESGIREPKPSVEQHNISQNIGEVAVTLDSQVDRFPRDRIYTGFKKACHLRYRFDSSDEGRLAYILDKDEAVEDWLRPAPNQFEGLFWRDSEGNSQHRYEPDFVVELSEEIVMVEVKSSSEIQDFDVQEKRKTSERYCELVSKNVGKYGIMKPWRYVIIPTEKIILTSTITNLFRR